MRLRPTDRVSSRYVPNPVTTQVPQTTYQRQTSQVPYTYTTTSYRCETRTRMVPVTRTRSETRTRTVNVTKYRTEQRTRMVAVQRCSQEQRTRDYTVTKYRTETRTREVPVQKQRMETRTREVPVTTMKYRNSYAQRSCHQVHEWKTARER